MVQARELSGISVCVVCVFCMWSFPPVAKLPNSWLILFESAEDLLSEIFFPSPNFQSSLPIFRRFFHPWSPDWHLYELD